LILRKIIKIVATRCHILKLKCTIKLRHGTSQAPRPTSTRKEGRGKERGIEGWIKDGRRGNRGGVRLEGKGRDMGKLLALQGFCLASSLPPLLA